LYDLGGLWDKRSECEIEEVFSNRTRVSVLVRLEMIYGARGEITREKEIRSEDEREMKGGGHGFIEG
jgi:hypothetical protein